MALKTQPKSGLSFREDSFDIDRHKEKAKKVSQKKIHVKLLRRQVWVGRRIIALLALALFVVVWLLLHNFF